MTEYSIKTIWTGGCYKALVMGRDGTEQAEYRLTAGKEAAETRKLRRALDRHLSNGGTLGNYQW